MKSLTYQMHNTKLKMKKRLRFEKTKLSFEKNLD